MKPLAVTILAVASLVLTTTLRTSAAESGELLNADHWSFQPRAQIGVPTIPDSRWVKNPIDAFVLRALRAKGLQPAPEADARTLLRRMTFDLHGLPPTPDELDSALRIPDSELVERLLKSPRYGERWARHWLDVARFCESQGYERDKMRPNAWHFRDYVINSLNADKPYDQFVREQIAGDVIVPVTREGIIATGFLVGGAYDEVGNSQQSKVMRSRVREEVLEDIISVVGQTFLGVTINCARCHDHKFDPIPQTDYYSVKAVFEGVRHGERTYFTPADITEHQHRAKALKLAIAQNEDRLRAIEQAGWEAFRQPDKSEEKLPGPMPFARWEFTEDARDTYGKLNGTLKGNAKITNGRLVLDGKGDYVATLALHRPIREKTLEAWVHLPDLNNRGGGVISLEGTSGSPFDAIVYGERQPRKWMAGSNGFRRTRDLEAASESAKPNESIHVAIVYATNNSITVYRNGRRYAEPYTPTGAETTVQTYAPGQARILFGMRHTGGGNPFLKGEIDEARLYDHALSAEEIAVSHRAGPKTLDTAEMLAQLPDDQRLEYKRLDERIARQFEELKELTQKPLTYAANPIQPEPTHLLARGDVLTKKELMAPRGLVAISSPGPEFGLESNAPEAERRRKFSAWVTHPDNPLFARVIVNRVWHHHFGRGIVDTPNDFGVSGSRPSHPELLDWLANWFVRNDFSLKKLHRLILTSATYRQSSEFNGKAAAIDADNSLLWRFTPKRLEAEAVRDSMLMLSGQINWQMGGPGYQPFDLFIRNTHFYIPKDKLGPEFNRRTIYRIGVQSLRDPLLDTLDCPDLSTKTPVRGVTTTPIQALALMNDSFVQRQAKHFAGRARMEGGPELKAQVNRAWQLALGRDASADEEKSGTELARQHGMEQLCWALLNSSEFIYVR